MPDTFTIGLALTKPEVGASDDTWGDKLNTNEDVTDEAITKAEVVALITGVNTLSDAQCRNGFMSFTGALSGGSTVEVVAKRRRYIAFNNTTGGFTVAVAVAGGGGASVNLTPGSGALLGCDGVDVVKISDVTATVVAATEAVAGVMKIVDAPTLEAGADDTEAITSAKLAGSKFNVIGKQSFLIPAVGLVPHPSSGPSLVTRATANFQIYRALAFADGVSTYAGYPIPLPKKVDVTQPISARLRYSSAASGNVRWTVGARAVGDGEAIDGARGTDGVITSTVAANMQETTAEFVVGINAGFAKEDTLNILVGRLGGDGADTLAAVADLISLEIICAIDKGNDA